MENIVILSPGSKIKKIRKLYNIRQHEITGGEITRNLISIIENDKANLTDSVAEILSNNINKLCKKNGFDYTVSKEYLLETETDQANKIADYYLKSLQKHLECKNELKPTFLDDLDSLEFLLLKYHLSDKKVLIFSKIGDIYFSKDEIYKAYTYYLKAYENSHNFFNTEIFFNILTNLGHCSMKLCKTNAALNFYSLALNSIDNVHPTLRFKVQFKVASIYRDMYRYEDALDQIESIEYNFKKEYIDEFELGLLKASCYKGKRFYSDALSLLENVNTSILGDHDKKLICYTSILDTLHSMRNTSTLKDYLDVYENNILNFTGFSNSEFTADVLLHLGLCFAKININDKATQYLRLSLNHCGNIKHSKIATKAILTLFDIYSKALDVQKVSVLSSTLIEFISAGIIQKNCTLVFEFIKFFNSNNASIEINNILNSVI